jgi:hypothetical protein
VPGCLRARVPAPVRVRSRRVPRPLKWMEGDNYALAGGGERGWRSAGGGWAARPGEWVARKRPSSHQALGRLPSSVRPLDIPRNVGRRAAPSPAGERRATARLAALASLQTVCTAVGSTATLTLMCCQSMTTEARTAERSSACPSASCARTLFRRALPSILRTTNKIEARRSRARARRSRHIPRGQAEGLRSAHAGSQIRPNTAHAACWRTRSAPIRSFYMARSVFAGVLRARLLSGTI